MVDNMTSLEIETFKKYNFRNVGSLLKPEITWWLMEGLVTKWDTDDRTIEEYSRILGVHHNTDIIVTPSLNQGFRL